MVHCSQRQLLPHQTVMWQRISPPVGDHFQLLLPSLSPPLLSQPSPSANSDPPQSWCHCSSAPFPWWPGPPWHPSLSTPSPTVRGTDTKHNSLPSSLPPTHPLSLPSPLPPTHPLSLPSLPPSQPVCPAAVRRRVPLWRSPWLHGAAEQPSTHHQTPH